MAETGAERVHVVDFHAAISGNEDNLEIARDIVKAVQIPVQLGGEIRPLSAIEQALELGVYRVVIGTVAMKDPDITERGH